MLIIFGIIIYIKQRKLNGVGVRAEDVLGGEEQALETGVELNEDENDDNAPGSLQNFNYVSVRK